MKLSVIIPVFNEKNTIKKILEKVKKLPFVNDIVVVDDGSVDGTTKILRNFPKQKKIKILFNK